MTDEQIAESVLRGMGSADSPTGQRLIDALKESRSAALRERDAAWRAALDRCRWMMDTCCDSSCERCGDLRALLEEAGK